MILVFNTNVYLEFYNNSILSIREKYFIKHSISTWIVYYMCTSYTNPSFIITALRKSILV